MFEINGNFFFSKLFAVLNGTDYLQIFEYQKEDTQPKKIFEYSSGGAILYDCLWDCADYNVIYVTGEEKFFEKIEIPKY